MICDFFECKKFVRGEGRASLGKNFVRGVPDLSPRLSDPTGGPPGAGALTRHPYPLRYRIPYPVPYPRARPGPAGSASAQGLQGLVGSIGVLSTFALSAQGQCPVGGARCLRQARLGYAP
jgi:hypothetical protein